MAQQTLLLRNIVDDLLLLSRLESEPATNKVEPVAVSDMLNALCEEARILSDEKKHHITLVADSDLILEGRADELRSAFSNLICSTLHTGRWRY
jgi:two-component system phosphate regulon sensor histidine kinase PhoR